MEVIKNVLIVLYLIICVALIIVTIVQNKDSQNSMEDIAENPRANKYYDKNKSRTRTGNIKKNTIILGIIFAILTIVLGIVYVL